MHDAAPVQFREGQRDLARVKPVGVRVEGRVVLQQVQKLPSGKVVHDEVQPPLSRQRVHFSDAGSSIECAVLTLHWKA